LCRPLLLFGNLSPRQKNHLFSVHDWQGFASAPNPGLLFCSSSNSLV